jgi:hypothetical protein
MVLRRHDVTVVPLLRGPGKPGTATTSSYDGINSRVRTVHSTLVESMSTGTSRVTKPNHVPST